jgi:hypothetical protein
MSEVAKLERLHQELIALEGLLPYLTGERKKRLERLVTEVRNQIANLEKKEVILTALRDVA